MKILPEIVFFDWNEGNIDKNFKKHGVTNKESEEVFDSKPKFIFVDIKHSLQERRYMIWGFTKSKRFLSVFFTMRINKIRIISARDMNKKERSSYEKKI